MLPAVSNLCKGYFKGGHDIRAQVKNLAQEDLFARLRIISYFTILFPACVGIVYSFSLLLERIHQEKSVNSDSSPVFFVWKQLFGQPLDEELNQFFLLPHKNQKLFFIRGYKTGLVFNPEREPIKLGIFTVSEPVIIVADTTLPKEILIRITHKIPPKYSYTTLLFSSINGVPTFKAFGFE